MAREEESFETLVKEAPLASAAGTVSLVGTLWQPCQLKVSLGILAGHAWHQRGRFSRRSVDVSAVAWRTGWRVCYAKGSWFRT